MKLVSSTGISNAHARRSPTREAGFGLRGSLAMVVASALLVGACAGTSSDTTTTTLGGDGPTDTASPESVALTVWTNLTTESQSEVIRQQVEACLATPDLEGVTADFEAVAFDVMFQRMLGAIDGGQVPSVMHSTSNMVAFLEGQDAIVPVNDVIDELGRDDFIESFVHATTTSDGTNWGVPDWALHQAVYYRTDLFEEAGVEIPTSWDELLDAAKTLTDGGTYGFIVPMGAGVSAAQHTFFQAMYSDGIFVFDPETGEYAFNRDLDRATRALEFLLQLYEESSPPASIEWGLIDYRTAFVGEQSAMTPEWGATVLMAAEQNPELLENLSAFEFPSPETGRAPAATLADGYYFVVGDNEDAEVEASKALISCLYDPVSVADRANSRPVFASPATQSATETAEYRENPYVQMFADELQMIREGPMSSWYRYGLEYGLNPLAGQIEGSDFIPRLMQLAALGNITAREAIEEIDAELQRIIAQLD